MDTTVFRKLPANNAPNPVSGINYDTVRATNALFPSKLRKLNDMASGVVASPTNENNNGTGYKFPGNRKFATMKAQFDNGRPEGSGHAFRSNNMRKNGEVQRDGESAYQGVSFKPGQSGMSKIMRAVGTPYNHQSTPDSQHKWSANYNMNQQYSMALHKSGAMRYNTEGQLLFALKDTEKPRRLGDHETKYHIFDLPTLNYHLYRTYKPPTDYFEEIPDAASFWYDNFTFVGISATDELKSAPDSGVHLMESLDGYQRQVTVRLEGRMNTFNVWNRSLCQTNYLFLIVKKVEPPVSYTIRIQDHDKHITTSKYLDDMDADEDAYETSIRKRFRIDGDKQDVGSDSEGEESGEESDSEEEEPEPEPSSGPVVEEYSDYYPDGTKKRNPKKTNEEEEEEFIPDDKKGDYELMLEKTQDSLTKKRYKLPFQVIPWSSPDNKPPPESVLTYFDENGMKQTGHWIRVGYSDGPLLEKNYRRDSWCDSAVLRRRRNVYVFVSSTQG